MSEREEERESESKFGSRFYNVEIYITMEMEQKHMPTLMSN